MFDTILRIVVTFTGFQFDEIIFVGEVSGAEPFDGFLSAFAGENVAGDAPLVRTGAEVRVAPEAVHLSVTFATVYEPEGKERVAVMRFRMTSGAKRARILFAYYLRFGFPHTTFRGIHRILLRQTFGDRLVDLANDIDGQTGLLGDGFHRGTTRLEQVGCSFGSTMISGHDQTGFFARRTATAMTAANMIPRPIRSGVLIGCFMAFFFSLVVFDDDSSSAKEGKPVSFAYFLRIIHVFHELFLEPSVFGIVFRTSVLLLLR